MADTKTKKVAGVVDQDDLNQKPIEALLGLMVVGRDEDKIQHDNAVRQLNVVAGESLDPDFYAHKLSVVSAVQNLIAQIDRKIEAQVNEILHNDQFKQLEASWRGLHHLVSNTQTGTSLKIRLMNVSKDELKKDFEKNPGQSFDQSVLFRKVYEDEYGTFGGHPFSCLVGDYNFGRSAGDITTLRGVAGVAAAAHAPFISAADPDLFGMESFMDLGTPRDLDKLFESTELIGWNEFRESEDSRYVALTMPHVLARLPYDRKNNPVDSFAFTEDSDGTDHDNFIWGNAAYALAERITSAYTKYGWCAAIRGVEGGGLVENLPAFTFPTDDGEIALKCPTEIAITDRREAELNDLGFISLCHKKGSGQAAFFGGQTANKPKLYNTPAANANARTSAMLPYIMAASRFAHYIKVMVRDKIGSFQSKEALQSYLNTWLSDYVLLNDTAPQSVKANFPLREGRIDVVEVPGKPGSFRAIAFLRPHFQLDELTVSLRLVAELPAPAA